MSYSDQQQQARRYLEQQIQNASPAQQIVLLYDGAIKFCRQAKAAIAAGDIEARCKANQRSMEIVSYLMSILDTEKGGEVGVRLMRIYGFLLTKMLDIDIKNDAAAADAVIEHLSILRQSWHQLDKQQLEVSPAQEAAAAKKNPAEPKTPQPARRSATA